MNENVSVNEMDQKAIPPETKPNYPSIIVVIFEIETFLFVNTCLRI